MDVSVSSAICSIPKDISDEDELLITFKHTFVKKDFDSQDISITTEDVYLLESININGTWNTMAEVYTCNNLDGTTTNCGAISGDDIKIMINRVKNRVVQINEVMISPNNLRTEPSEYWYSDALI